MYTIILDQPIVLPDLADSIKEELAYDNDFLILSMDSMQRLVRPAKGVILTIDLPHGRNSIKLYGRAGGHQTTDGEAPLFSPAMIRDAETAELSRLTVLLQDLGYVVERTEFMDTFAHTVRTVLIVFAIAAACAVGFLIWNARP